MGQFCSQQCVPGERFIGLGPPPPPPPHSELPRLPARLRIEYCASSNYVVPFLRVKAKLESNFSAGELRVIEAADISLQSSGRFEITLLNTQTLLYSTLGATSDEGREEAPDGVEGAWETQLVVQRPSRSGFPCETEEEVAALVEHIRHYVQQFEGRDGGSRASLRRSCV